uniref:Uncharacterized protein n=1 Tax=Romanomermis culicivorax TaxID=13658 RepID=A0A915K4I6_ROMCU
MPLDETTLKDKMHYELSAGDVVWIALDAELTSKSACLSLLEFPHGRQLIEVSEFKSIKCMDFYHLKNFKTSNVFVNSHGRGRKDMSGSIP